MNLSLIHIFSPTDRVIPSLLHADSLIEVGCADSALSILEGVNLAELSTIQSRATVSYTHLNAARSELGVSVGPGRGSAAGSAVAYCLGITKIDPIQYLSLIHI